MKWLDQTYDVAKSTLIAYEVTTEGIKKIATDEDYWDDSCVTGVALTTVRPDDGYGWVRYKNNRAYRGAFDPPETFSLPPPSNILLHYRMVLTRYGWIVVSDTRQYLGYESEVQHRLRKEKFSLQPDSIVARGVFGYASVDDQGRLRISNYPPNHRFIETGIVYDRETMSISIDDTSLRWEKNDKFYSPGLNDPYHRSSGRMNRPSFLELTEDLADVLGRFLAGYMMTYYIPSLV